MNKVFFNHISTIGIRILLFSLITLGAFSDLSSQNFIDVFSHWTAQANVVYSPCDGTLAVSFPLAGQADGINGNTTNRLNYVDIYARPNANGSKTLLTSVYRTSSNTTNVNKKPATHVASSNEEKLLGNVNDQRYNYSVSISGSPLSNVKNWSIALNNLNQQIVTIIFDDLPNSYFGFLTEIEFDNGFWTEGVDGVNGFDLVGASGNHKEQATFKQSTIEKPTGLTLTQDGCNRVTVGWNDVEIPGESPITCPNNWVVEIYRDNVKIGEKQYSPFIDPATNLVPSQPYNYKLRSRWNPNTKRQYVSAETDVKSHTIDDYKGNIKGKVTSLSDGGVGGITVTATLNNAFNLGCFPLPVGVQANAQFTDVTDPDGSYSITNLFVGTENHPIDASYTVVASRAGRNIGPSSQSVSLSYGSMSNFELDVDFTDSSAATITGIVSDFTGCGLVEAEVSVIVPPDIIDVTTDENGAYTLQLPGVGTYDIRSTYKGEVLINEDVAITELSTSGIDFMHTLRDTISGFVGAGCQEYIGGATLSARIGSCPPFEMVSTNDTGYYEMIVPRRDVTVKVTDINLIPNTGLVEVDVFAAISADSTISVDSSTIYDVIYRRPLIVDIDGMPPPSCAAVPYPILDQGSEYVLDINIWEILNVCPSDTGTITINNFISGTSTQNQVDTTFGFANGRARYIFNAGDPMLTGDNVKDLNITVAVGNRTEMIPIQAIVTGGRPRGETFITAPVELPFMILRDPPGDQSFSFFEENNSFSYSQSFDYSTEETTKAWIKAKAGTEIFSFKAWGTIAGSLTVGATQSNSEENTVTISNSNSFKTSSDQGVVGDEGDIYVGAGVNFRYSLADILEFDLLTCSLSKDTSLFLSPEGFATSYLYTEGHIKDVLIPQLQFNLNDAIATNKPDSVINYQRNAINVWEQAIALNAELKEIALSGTIDSLSVENYSYDANVEDVTRSVTTSRSQSRTINFKSTINAGVAAELGFELSGSGLSAGVDFNFRTSIGNSEKTTINTSNTIGYVYNDDDQGDFISFDVGIDPVYGSPVFGNILGETSCPHEGSTVRRDDMEFSVIGSPISIVPEGQSIAFFNLEIGNIGESVTDNSRSFTVDVSSNNIPAGITIRSTTGDFPRTITVDNGQSATIGVEIIRSIGSPTFTLEGREFTVTPACDENSFKKSIYLSAYFASPCSELEMPTPDDNWLVTQASANLLNIVVDDYDLATTIDEIVLEFGDADNSSWTTSNVILTGSAISTSPNGTSVNWDVSDLPDGAYKIRWRLKCNGTTFNYSPRKFGIIDRSAPRAIGRPQPSDNNYISGDEISVNLDQMVDCSALSSTDISFTSQPGNNNIPYQFQCLGDQITIVPSSDISNNIGASYRVEIVGLRDELGNVSGDTITWNFVVNDVDSDGDGISDSDDICPGGNDFYDSDLGGTPDDCDCNIISVINEFIEDNDCDNILNEDDICPEIPDVALNFDGINDYVLLPNESTFDITDSMTVEAWVKVDEFDIPNQAIVTKGDNTWRIARNWIHSTISFALNGVGQIDGTIEVDDNTWHHIAGVYDGATMSLYIDGLLDMRINGSGSIATSDDPVIIGSNYQGNSPSRFFDGSIDDVILWDRALSQVEILETMAASVELNMTGLLGYYTFNDDIACQNSTQTTLTDSTLLSNTGTLMNFSLSEGCVSNWSSGANKIESCNTCQEILELTSSLGVLDGTYSAKDQIIIKAGALFISGNTVNLSAPIIDFENDISIPLQAILNTDSKGCQE